MQALGFNQLNSCNIWTNDLIKEKTYLYELYLLDLNNVKVPVPVKIINFKDGKLLFLILIFS